MALKDRLKSVLGGGDEERTYTHECEDCGAAIESQFRSPTAVSCPECGSPRTQTAFE